METRKAAIELPFGVWPEAIHCPVCGKQILGEGFDPQCDHVAFTYSDYVGEFDYVAPWLDEIAQKALDRWDAFQDEDEDEDEHNHEHGSADQAECPYEHPLDVLLEEYPSPSLLCLAVTTGGMACGPVWATFHLGIEFHVPEKQ